jgi:amidase
MTADGMGMALRKAATRDQFEPLTWAVIEMGRGNSSAQYLLAVNLLQRTTRDLAHQTVDFDLVLTPTLAEPPVPLGTFDAPQDNPLYPLDRAEEFMPFTAICNVTGQPAMNVPLYWNDEGLPIGVQFIAKFGDEATLFRLAAQLEEARPWAERRPSVSA